MAVLTGRSILGVALPYRGRVPYVWGGANPGGWDCSGMVNWDLGKRLGLTLPGDLRGFDGSTHGPVVLDYVTWGGARTVPGPPSPGDLCIWTGGGFGGHIGFALNGTHMISALDPQFGTVITPIAGNGPPGPLMFRRVTGVPGGPGLPAGGGGGNPWAEFFGALSAGDLGLAQAIAGAAGIVRNALGSGALIAAGLVAAYAATIVAVAGLAGILLGLGAIWALRHLGGS
jgi:hypothetical protein